MGILSSVRLALVVVHFPEGYELPERRHAVRLAPWDPRCSGRRGRRAAADRKARVSVHGGAACAARASLHRSHEDERSRLLEFVALIRPPPGPRDHYMNTQMLPFTPDRGQALASETLAENSGPHQVFPDFADRVEARVDATCPPPALHRAHRTAEKLPTTL